MTDEVQASNPSTTQQQSAPVATTQETQTSSALPGTMAEAAQRIKKLSQPESTPADTEQLPRDTNNELSDSSTEADENVESLESEQLDPTDDSDITDDDTLRSNTDAQSDADDQLEIDASQFSELLNLKDDQLIVNDEGNVTFKTRVDGVDSEVTLPELLKSYQNEATLTNRSMEVTALIKAREETLSNANALAEQQAQYTATLLETMNNDYMADLKQADLNQLRIDDPAEYSAKQIEFTQRQQKIKDFATQSLTLLQEQQASQKAEQQRIDNERIPVEAKALRDYFKPLKVEVNDALQNDLTTYLNNQNFSSDEVNKMVDHRIMILAYKAKQFDQGMKRATDKTVKKKLPKVIKSGTKPSKKAVSQEKAVQLRNRARQSGSIEDALARVRQMNN